MPTCAKCSVVSNVVSTSDVAGVHYDQLACGHWNVLTGGSEVKPTPTDIETLDAVTAPTNDEEVANSL